VVPTTSLVEQMTNDFADYGYGQDNIHKIYSGKEKDTMLSVVISTWQSIYKLNHAWFEQFGMVIGDECHGFKSKSLTSIMNKCTEAAYRFGTTGTLDGTQTHELVLQGLFGRVHKVTTTRTLQDNDTLAKLEIKRLVLEYKEDFGKRSYQDEIDYIVRHEKRNQFIRNLALDQKGNTLVLFQFVEKHGKILHNLIEEKAHDGRKVFFVSGATETSDREAIRKITEKQSDAIIVASLGTFLLGSIFVISIILYLLLRPNHKSESYNQSEGVFVNQMTGESLNCTISRMTLSNGPPNKILLYCIPMND
jgi:superfamily II DNA or RNA helicase